MPEIRNAKIISIVSTDTLKKGNNKGRRILHVDILISPNEVKTYYILEHEIYAFDIIKNFKFNKYAIGDTIDFQYNEGAIPQRIWRIYNHKRTRDES